MNGLVTGLVGLLAGGPLLVVVSLAGVAPGASHTPPSVSPTSTRVPAALRQTFTVAAARYGVPAPVLEAVAYVESSFHAGAVGPWVPGGPALGIMQFLPATYAAYTVVAHSTPLDPGPAILAAARLLAADGRTAQGWDDAQALFAYNHSTAYVAEVLATAPTYGYRRDVA